MNTDFFGETHLRPRTQFFFDFASKASKARGSEMKEGEEGEKPDVAQREGHTQGSLDDDAHCEQIYQGQEGL